MQVLNIMGYVILEDQVVLRYEKYISILSNDRTPINDVQLNY